MSETTTKRKRRRRNECNAANYEDDVLELIQAVDVYRRRCHRSFPPWSEVLAILKALGYRRVEERGDRSIEDCVDAAIKRQVVEPIEPVEPQSPES